ncbi:Isoleucine--tRNA ligase, cytoplasmic [Leucoagaricus sp. SymC.cos]|nr:Isoleucine--tRNA ligase, cytoplasmic [Leucoagaricus sp. SymC.cos]
MGTGFSEYFACCVCALARHYELFKQLPQEQRGRGDHSHSLLKQEGVRAAAQNWHMNQTIGTVTPKKFHAALQDEILPSLSVTFTKPPCEQTATRWMIKLGWWMSVVRKGVYMDGHEQADVVKYQQEIFLPKLAGLECQIACYVPNPETGKLERVEPDLAPGEKEIIPLWQDETCCQANEHASSAWLREDQQPLQWNTVIPMSNSYSEHCGKTQKMMTDDGLPKGLQQTLEECGFTSKDLPKQAKCSPVCPWDNYNCCMAHLLSRQEDFANQISMLKKIIVDAGHICIFLPKFHCELNLIEIRLKTSLLMTYWTNILSDEEMLDTMSARPVLDTNLEGDVEVVDKDDESEELGRTDVSNVAMSDEDEKFEDRDEKKGSNNKTSDSEDEDEDKAKAVTEDYEFTDEWNGITALSTQESVVINSRREQHSPQPLPLFLKLDNEIKQKTTQHTKITRREDTIGLQWVSSQNLVLNLSDRDLEKSPVNHQSPAEVYYGPDLEARDKALGYCLYFQTSLKLFICATCSVLLTSGTALDHVKNRHPNTGIKGNKKAYDALCEEFGIRDTMPTPQELYGRPALGGIILYESALLCMEGDCRAIYSTSGAMYKHHRNVHPDTKTIPTSWYMVQAQKLDRNHHTTLFRVEAAPLPAPIKDSLDDWIDEVSDRIDSIVNPVKLNHVDPRNVNAWLTMTSWPEHVGDHSPRDLAKLVAHPNSSEFPQLQKAVEFIIEGALGLLKETPKIIRRKLNTNDSTSGVNHKLFQKLQTSDSTDNYIAILTKLVAFFLREKKTYLLPLPNEIEDRIRHLRGMKLQYPIEESSPSLDFDDYVERIVDLLMSIWTCQWDPSYDNDIGDPTLCFVALSSIREDLSWVQPKYVMPMIASLVYCMRCVFLYCLHIPLPAQQNLDIRKRYHLLDTWKDENRESTWSELYTLQHLASSFARTTPSFPAYLWLDNKCTTCLWQGHEITLDGLRAMARELHRRTYKLFMEEVMMGLDIQLEYDKLFDDLSNSSPHYGFVSDQRNAHLLKCNQMLKAILRDKALSKEFLLGRRPNGKPILNLSRCREWLRVYAELLVLLMANVEFMGGSPSRGTEMTCIQIRNTATRTRGLYALKRHIAVVCQYTKTRAVTSKDTLLPHSLDAFNSSFLVHVVLLLHEFAQFLVAELWPHRPEIAQLYHTHLFVKGDRLFDTEDLSAVLRKVTQATLGDENIQSHKPLPYDPTLSSLSSHATATAYDNKTPPPAQPSRQKSLSPEMENQAGVEDDGADKDEPYFSVKDQIMWPDDCDIEDSYTELKDPELEANVVDLNSIVIPGWPEPDSTSEKTPQIPRTSQNQENVSNVHKKDSNSTTAEWTRSTKGKGKEREDTEEKQSLESEKGTETTQEGVVCVGSVAELERLSGVTGITDIHREKIDHMHPGDFVSEGIDQTRSWFYTLLVLSMHLFGGAPWKNLIVTGLVLAVDGKKMSKSLKNYPDPNLIIDKYGAEATRMFLVNSPIVRGDNLRFREGGVREVISRILLPWLNPFRFFLGHVALLKKTNNVDFMYNSKAPLPSNVIDRWILARCQSLIKLVRKEMAAYRLYTNIPRLLDLFDELTNWYIRFNRKRLKGEDGVEDTIAALNTLFETLFTLRRTMSSYTPFLTENLYETLRKFISEDSSAGNARLVHFLLFPEVKEEYFDEVIERQVKRMQTVIELTRNIREKNNLSLKASVPLKELLIFHPEPEYIADIKPLQRYIESELNVRDIIFTSDESLSGVRYRAVADWAVLGKKLRKDLGQVKNALFSVSSDAGKAYVDTGKINVDGIELIAGDLTVQRYLELPSGAEAQYATNTDSDVVVHLDIQIHADLQSEWLARELTNRVQKLRKKAGLQATDDVDIYYQFEDGMGAELVAVIGQHEGIIRKTVGSVPVDIKVKKTGSTELILEEQEVAEVKFMLYLVRP